MNTTGERINDLIGHFKLSKNGFAQRLNVSSTVINGIVKDDHKPGSKILDAIKREFPNVSTDWLLSGDGEMFKDSSRKNSESDDYLREHLKTLETNFARLAAQLETKDQQIASLQETQKSLQEMLKMVLGKPNGVPRRPNRTLPLTQSKANGAYALSTTN